MTKFFSVLRPHQFEYWSIGSFTKIDKYDKDVINIRLQDVLYEGVKFYDNILKHKCYCSKW